MRAPIVDSNFVADYVIAHSLDKQGLAVWTVRVLVLVIWNVAEIWIEHSSVLCHTVCFF